MVEALYSSEMSVVTTATPRNVSEESILHTISLSDTFLLLTESLNYAKNNLSGSDI
jgi:hypothetical protein